MIFKKEKKSVRHIIASCIQDTNLFVVLLIIWKKRSHCLEDFCPFLWITSKITQQLNYSVNEAIPPPPPSLHNFSLSPATYPLFCHQSTILPRTGKWSAEGGGLGVRARLRLIIHCNMETHVNLQEPSLQRRKLRRQKFARPAWDGDKL